MKDNKRPLNDEIKASKVKLINEEGEALGETTLSEAKTKAKELNLDLMQLGKEGDFTIIKMLDYGKFLYKQKKIDQKNKQKGKAPDLKTIKITFKIGDHDLEFKKNQAEKFAKDGHPLKVMLVLRGRENHYEAIAAQKIETFVSMLESFYKIDKKLVRAGSNFIVMMLPK
ncbi:MAG: translation initiation factor IF-3 [Candidatus Gracilibacteria bacterium]|nr:translation initiation factor IF-3 [Candidatus Gracilibacteria bacterium]